MLWGGRSERSDQAAGWFCGILGGVWCWVTLPEVLMRSTVSRRLVAALASAFLATACASGKAPNDTADGGDVGACTAETAQATCVRLQLACGMQDGVDNCGTGVRVDCVCAADGGLTMCGAGELGCDGVCVSETDLQHCGSCQNACPAGATQCTTNNAIGPSLHCFCGASQMYAMPLNDGGETCP